MLEIYDVLMNFTLNGDKYFATGVFMNEDKAVCEGLCKAKFIKARVKPQTMTIKVTGANISKQLAHMNKGELQDIADEENIKLPDGLTNKEIREHIKTQRKRRKGAKK